MTEVLRPRGFEVTSADAGGVVKKSGTASPAELEPLLVVATCGQGRRTLQLDYPPSNTHGSSQGSFGRRFSFWGTPLCTSMIVGKRVTIGSKRTRVGKSLGRPSTRPASFSQDFTSQGSDLAVESEVRCPRSATFICLRIAFDFYFLFPLLVLKGIHHYWTRFFLFFPGALIKWKARPCFLAWSQPKTA